MDCEKLWRDAAQEATEHIKALERSRAAIQPTPEEIIAEMRRWFLEDARWATQPSASLLLAHIESWIAERTK